ncbi:hypothetical protein ASC76_15955 [Rhizobacter sp. Root404]|nr:hypothetical protein ASC76_15955 [Rhizobacter sp. Root404]
MLARWLGRHLLARLFVVPALRLRPFGRLRVGARLLGLLALSGQSGGLLVLALRGLVDQLHLALPLGALLYLGLLALAFDLLGLLGLNAVRGVIQPRHRLRQRPFAGGPGCIQFRSPARSVGFFLGFRARVLLRRSCSLRLVLAALLFKLTCLLLPPQFRQARFLDRADLAALHAAAQLGEVLFGQLARRLHSRRGGLAIRYRRLRAGRHGQA